MKAKLQKQSNDQKFLLHVPLEDFLVALLTPEQRKMFGDCELDVYIDSARDDEAEDVVVLSYYKSQDFKPDAEGKLVAVEREKLGRCATKKEIQELRERVQELDQRTIGQMRAGG